MWIFGLFFFFFLKVWIRHSSVLFVSIFPVKILKLPCKFWSVENQCTKVTSAWMIFFVQNSKTTSQQQQCIRIGFRKILLAKELQSTPWKKKKRTCPVKQKNIAPSLAHKKEEDDKTISQMERIVQDWSKMAYKGWIYSLL